MKQIFITQQPAKDKPCWIFIKKLRYLLFVIPYLKIRNNIELIELDSNMLSLLSKFNIAYKGLESYVLEDSIDDIDSKASDIASEYCKKDGRDYTECEGVSFGWCYEITLLNTIRDNLLICAIIDEIIRTERPDRIIVFSRKIFNLVIEILKVKGLKAIVSYPRYNRIIDCFLSVFKKMSISLRSKKNYLKVSVLANNPNQNIGSDILFLTNFSDYLNIVRPITEKIDYANSHTYVMDDEAGSIAQSSILPIRIKLVEFLSSKSDAEIKKSHLIRRSILSKAINKVVIYNGFDLSDNIFNDFKISLISMLSLFLSSASRLENGSSSKSSSGSGARALAKATLCC